MRLIFCFEYLNDFDPLCDQAPKKNNTKKSDSLVAKPPREEEESPQQT